MKDRTDWWSHGQLIDPQSQDKSIRHDWENRSTAPPRAKPDSALSKGEAAAGHRQDFFTDKSPMPEVQLKAFL